MTGRDDPLLEAELDDLRGGLRNLRAPGDVELELRQAFRARRVREVAAAVQAGSAMAATAATAATARRRGATRRVVYATAAMAASVAIAVTAAIAIGDRRAATADGGVAVVRLDSGSYQAQAAFANQQAVAATPRGAFLPLLYAPRVSPRQSYSVVRMRIPLSSLVIAQGGPAGGMIEADVLVGEDGLASGIFLDANDPWLMSAVAR